MSGRGVGLWGANIRSALREIRNLQAEPSFCHPAEANTFGQLIARPCAPARSVFHASSLALPLLGFDPSRRPVHGMCGHLAAKAAMGKTATPFMYEARLAALVNRPVQRLAEAGHMLGSSTESRVHQTVNHEQFVGGDWIAFLPPRRGGRAAA